LEKNTEQDYQAIRNDVNQLRSDIASLLKTAQSSGKENFQQTHEEVVEKLKHSSGKVSQQAHEVSDQIEQKYQEKPLIFMIGAFLIGLLLGRVLNNK